MYVGPGVLCHALFEATLMHFILAMINIFSRFVELGNAMFVYLLTFSLLNFVQGSWLRHAAGGEKNLDKENVII